MAYLFFFIEFLFISFRTYFIFLKGSLSIGRFTYFLKKRPYFLGFFYLKLYQGKTYALSFPNWEFVASSFIACLPAGRGA